MTASDDGLEFARSYSGWLGSYAITLQRLQEAPWWNLPLQVRLRLQIAFLLRNEPRLLPPPP